MTAELLILLHYFKGKAAPLLRCLSCHFLFPHFLPVRAGGGSARAGRVPPVRWPRSVSVPPSGIPALPHGAFVTPLGHPAPRVGCPSGGMPGARAGCPQDVPGSLASVGGGVAACVPRAPAHCSGGGFWAAMSPPVTSTPRLQPQRSGQSGGGFASLGPQPRASLFPLAPRGMWRCRFPKYLMGTGRLQGTGDAEPSPASPRGVRSVQGPIPAAGIRLNPSGSPAVP